MTSRRWKITTPSWEHEVTTTAALVKLVSDESERITEAPVELKKFVGKRLGQLLAWAAKAFDDQVEHEEIKGCSSEACAHDAEDTCEGCGTALCESHAMEGQFDARTLCDECLFVAVQREVEGEDGEW